MLRSKRTFSVILSLAFGVGAMAALNHFDLLPGSGSDEPVANTASTRPKPLPTSGEAASNRTKTATDSSRTAHGVDEVGVPGTLIPTDTTLYVEISSFAAIERVVRDLVGKIDPRAAMMMDGEAVLEQMLGPFGAEIADVDKRRPLGLAVTMAGQGEPRPTILLPVRDPQEFKRDLSLAPGLAEPRLASQYVGLALGPGYPVSSAGSPVAFTFDPATVNVYLDLDPIRAQILEGMEQAGLAGSEMVGSLDSSTSAAYEQGQELGREVLAATDHVELAVDLTNGRLGLQAALGLSEGSSWVRPVPESPPDLARLAAFARPDDHLTMVGGWDRSFVDGVIRPFMDRLSDIALSEEDELVFDQVEAVLTFLPTLGDELGVFASLEVGSAHLAVVARPPDADTLLAMTSMALAGVDRDLLPVAIGPFREVMVDGGCVARLIVDVSPTYSVDAEVARTRKMLSLLFGSQQIQVQLTSQGGWLVFTLGSDETWREELLAVAAEDAPSNSSSAPFTELIGRAQGGSPAVAYEIDLAAMQVNVLTLMGEHMGLDVSAELDDFETAVGTEPLTISAYAAVHGDRWASGFELELDRLMRLLELAQ